MAIWTERSEVRTKTTEGQYSPVRLELVSLVSSLLYGTRTMLVLSLPAFKNKKYTAYDRFHGNSPYGEIATKKEPIRMLGFTLPYNKFSYLQGRYFRDQLLYIYPVHPRGCLHNMVHCKHCKDFALTITWPFPRGKKF